MASVSAIGRGSYSQGSTFGYEAQPPAAPMARNRTANLVTPTSSSLASRCRRPLCRRLVADAGDTPRPAVLLEPDRRRTRSPPAPLSPAAPDANPHTPAVAGREAGRQRHPWLARDPLARAVEVVTVLRGATEVLRPQVVERDRTALDARIVERRDSREPVAADRVAPLLEAGQDVGASGRIRPLGGLHRPGQ